jgi:hypothetical protein
MGNEDKEDRGLLCHEQDLVLFAINLLTRADTWKQALGNREYQCFSICILLNRALPTLMLPVLFLL